MTPRKWTGRPPGRPKGSTGAVRVMMLVRLRPDQRAALERLAEQDRRGRGLRRLDLSAALRRLLDTVLGLKAPAESVATPSPRPAKWRRK